MRPMAVALVLVFGGALLPAGASAQRPGGGGPQANVTVSSAEVLFPSPTYAEFDNGWVDHGGVTVTVEPRNKNRQNWQLFVQAAAADMGGYGKPVQDILVRVQGSASWTPLSTTAQMVAEGTGTGTVTLYYRLLLDWSLDAPGTYTVSFDYSSTTF